MESGIYKSENTGRLMFQESVGEGSENARRMLRMHCLKILEVVWILEGIVTPVSLRWCHSRVQASA